MTVIKSNLRPEDLVLGTVKPLRVALSLEPDAMAHLQHLADAMDTSKSKIIEAMLRVDRTEGEVVAELND